MKFEGLKEKVWKMIPIMLTTRIIFTNCLLKQFVIVSNFLKLAALEINKKALVTLTTNLR